MLLISTEAFDTEKLLRVMDKLKRSQAVDIPKYDFKGYKSDVFPARRVSRTFIFLLLTYSLLLKCLSEQAKIDLVFYLSFYDYAKE